MKPRVFLAEDDSSIRQMLAFFLTRMCRCEVIGESGDGSEALQQCEKLAPAVVIADLRLPGLSGVELLRELRRRALGVKVMFYTGTMHEGCLVEAMEAEPEGFVLKSDEISCLRQAVQVICTGASFWSKGVAQLRKERSTFAQRFASLTQSERDVLELIAMGKSTKEVALMLRKSGHTVAHQRQSIMDKLAVHNVVALAALVRDVRMGPLSCTVQSARTTAPLSDAYGSATSLSSHSPARRSPMRA